MEFLKKLLISMVAVILASCMMEERAVVSVGVSLESLHEKNNEHDKVEWTVMIYMPADNTMEKAAIQDLNEMEASDCDFTNIHAVALIDSNQYREGYEDEWNGTRLYEIRKDSNGNHEKISSLRLGSKELGLSGRVEKELDMSDPDILEKFVSSTARYYPAEHYAFILWGECSGYSGSKSKARAVAFDDTSSSFMQNSDFAMALEKGLDGKFDVLAMDSCFGSEIELLSEFEQCADYFVGMEGLQKIDGWDYRSLLSAINKECKDGKEFGESLMESQVINNISLVDLSGISSLSNEFDMLAKKLSSSINSKTEAEIMKKEILDSDFCFMSYGTSVNPVYVDIAALAEKYGGFNLISCVKQISKCKNEKYGGIGVFFCNKDYNGKIMQEIPEDYVKDGRALNCKFVNNSEYYVFTEEKKGTLLDKLFGNYFN